MGTYLPPPALKNIRLGLGDHIHSILLVKIYRLVNCCYQCLKKEILVVECFERLAVTIVPFIPVIVYGCGSNRGLNLWVLFYFNRTWSPI